MQNCIGTNITIKHSEFRLFFSW